MAEPNDWKDVDPGDWVDAEGGAEGGAPDTAPSKPVGTPAPKVAASFAAPEDPEVARQKTKDVMVSLTHGQGVPLEQQDERGTRHVAGALGEGIAFARGTPLVGSHIDELSALLQAHAATGPEYQKKLQEARGAVNQAVKDNPKGPLMGSLAFAPMLPETAPGRIGLSAAEGLSEGVGSAPDLKSAPRSGAVGLATGTLHGLGGEALIQGGKALGRAREGVMAKNQAAADKLIDRNFASARGAYGGNVASANNLIQSAERAAEDPRLPEAMRQAAKDWLDTPEALALREQVARSNLGRGEDALSRISSSQDAMHEAAAKMTPEARAAAAQARLNDPSALTRRLRELGPKVILPMIGGALAGPAGAGAGALGGAVLGRSGTTVRNLMADPYVASRVLGAGEGVLGSSGSLMTSATPAAVQAWESLLKKDEEKK